MSDMSQEATTVQDESQPQEDAVNLEATNIQPEQDTETGENDSNDEQAEEETVITFEDKQIKDESDSDSSVVRTLRQSYKEKDKRVRELEKQLQELQEPATKEIQQPQRPKLADFDYDEEKYEQAMDSFMVKNRDYQEQIHQQKQAQEKEQQSFKQKLEQYNSGKSDLKLRDYEDAEDIVKGTLNPTQQGILIDSADNSALLVYALGKSPEKLKELSEIKNPIHYVKALVKLESQIKTAKQRRPKTEPEKTLKGGTGAASTQIQSELARLRANASKTGNFTKVKEFRRKNKI